MDTFKFLKHSYRRKVNKLSEWRDRYESNEYPEKVVLNLFYDLYTLKEFWPSFETIFKGDVYDVSLIPKEKLSVLINDDYSKDDSRVLVNNNKLWEQFALDRLNKVRPVLLELMKSNILVGNIEYKKFKELIEETEDANTLIEEIEYGYIFYELVIEMIMIWAAYGKLGYDRITASIATTGMVAGSFNFRNLETTIDSFSEIVAMVIPQFQKRGF